MSCGTDQRRHDGDRLRGGGFIAQTLGKNVQVGQFIWDQPQTLRQRENGAPGLDQIGQDVRVVGHAHRRTHRQPHRLQQQLRTITEALR